MNDGTKRYFLETSYNEDGSTHAAVMERKKAFCEAEEIEYYNYEWRACKRIDELIKQAYERGEEVIYNHKYCDMTFKRINNHN